MPRSHQSPLCCCEYLDSAGERRHLLEVCCNCQELDLCCDRLIRCRRIPVSLVRGVMSSVAERARLPWLGGAQPCSPTLLAPFISLPLLLLTAAQGVWLSILLFSLLPIFLTYLHFILMRSYSLSPFFFIWNIVTFLTIFVIFEFIGVKLLEIRPDENMVFVILVVLVFLSLYKIKEKERYSYVLSDFCPANSKTGALLCPTCNILVPPRTVHCYACQVCVFMRGQHCAWFNCCIGEWNHRWYMVYLLSSLSTMLLCSNLILTTACHPVPLLGPILRPDDCTQVYFDILYALCFVSSLYCLEVGVFLLAVLFLEVCLISLGLTGDEFRNRRKRSVLCGLCLSSPASRPHSLGFLRNWYNYLKGPVGSGSLDFTI